MSRGDIGPVAVVCHFPPPPGGMPGQAELLVTLLERDGVRARRVRTNLGGGRLAQRVDRLRVVRSLLRLPVYLLRLVLAVPAVRIVHVFSHSGLGFFLFTAPAVLLGRLLGRRVIVSYHGGGLEPFLAGWAFPALTCLRAASATAVPSGFLADVFEAHGLRAFIVPNVVEVERFSWQGDRDPFPVFLSARHLEAIYGNDVVLRAFARVLAATPGARLIVLGAGTQAEALRALAHELGVSDAVEFPGYVPAEAIPSWYRRAGILLNASRVDNMPMAILEAFAAGLPVVTTRAGGIPYIVDDGKTGLLVDVDDAAALAAGALRLLGHPAEARALSHAARDAVADYTWPHVRDRLAALYDGERGEP
jgi:phenylacetate-CoA ligase